MNADFSHVDDSLFLKYQVRIGKKDSVGSFSITYLGKFWEPVLGEMDSTRHYSINGQTATLSKNNGLVMMPKLVSNKRQSNSAQWWSYNFEQAASSLKAISLPNGKGIRIPSVSDYNPYFPGDTLGYVIDYSPQSIFWRKTFQRFAITKRDTIANKLVINYTREEATTTYLGNQNWSPFDLPTSYKGQWIISLDSVVRTGALLSLNEVVGLQLVNGMIQDTGRNGNGLISILTSGLAWVETGPNCFAGYQDGGASAVIRQEVGLTSAQISMAVDLTLDCYSLNGKGIPCKPFNQIVLSTTEAKGIDYRVLENPIANDLIVQSPTPLHLTLQDMQGRNVIEGFETTQLNTAQLPAGLYVLKIKDRQGHSSVQRVVKE
jgi:hypothetical protein